MTLNYSISSLVCSRANVTIELTAPEASPVQESIDLDGWEIYYAHLSPSKNALLLYCPHPEPGLACIQVREQTAYDLWLEWEGDNAPQLFLDDRQEPEPLKQSEQRAYLSLNWGNFVGASCLRIKQAAQTLIELCVEVRSRKVDYLSDYRLMLDDISEHLAALIFDFGSPTAAYHGRLTSEEHVAYLDYLFLRYLMDNTRVPLHFRLVASAPHRTTQREAVWVDVSQVRHITPRTITTLLTHPEHLADARRTSILPIVDRYVPVTLLDERIITSFDTPPNRFVKHFLTQLIAKLRELERIFNNARGAHLVADCRRWRQEIESLARVYFLEEVGPMHFYPTGSQVLLKQEGYRQLNDYYRRFLLTGRVQWQGFEDLIRAPNKDLATLYEYWCFFELLDVIAVILSVEIDPRQFIVEENNQFKITINQNGKSKGQVGHVMIYYNRYFRRPSGESYSVTLHPDYVIERSDGRRIILDAKYKVDDVSSLWADDDQTEREEEERLIYKKGDLYKMHTYRDALGAQAVFVLYPGNQFRAYHINGQMLTQAAHLTPDFEGVGAIPVKPGMVNTIQACIGNLLSGNLAN